MPVKRYVLTGAPGAGKTSVLSILGRQGFAVVDEAATDVISAEQDRGVAEPWQADGFIDKIVSLQVRRQQEPVAGGARVQLYDRSPLCTLALARYLRHPVTPALADEIERITREGVYERAVFLVRPIGFIEHTQARRISYPESLAFGSLHESVYLDHDFELVDVPAGSATERAAVIADFIASRP